MPPRLAGLVDMHDLPDRLGGWVEARVGDTAIEVVALMDGKEVGRVRPRPDKGGKAALAFTIAFECPQAFGTIESGRLAVHVARGDDLEPALPIWPVLAKVDRLAAALAVLTACKHDFGAEFAPTVKRLLDSHGANIDRRAAMAEVPGTAGLQSRPVWASPLSFASGLPSRGADAILGIGGWVFLTGGSNDVLAQYADTSVAVLAARWLDLFRGRRTEALRRGIGYVQTIIPEKITALPEFFPYVIETPTPLLKAVESGIDGGAVPDLSYVSGRREIAADALRWHMYRKVDSHLAPYGAWRLARAVATQIGAPPPAMPAFDLPVVTAADLGDRFFDRAAVDVVQTTSDLEVVGVTPKRLGQHFPSFARHLGWRQDWRCETAPIKARVMVFGNSFFNLVEDGQGCLSYWFARWFSAFHFVWNPSIDWDLAASVGADVVVGQTIERFLPEVPTH